MLPSQGRQQPAPESPFERRCSVQAPHNVRRLPRTNIALRNTQRRESLRLVGAHDMQVRDVVHATAQEGRSVNEGAMLGVPDSIVGTVPCIATWHPSQTHLSRESGSRCHLVAPYTSLSCMSLSGAPRLTTPETKLGRWLRALPLPRSIQTFYV